MKIAVLGTGMVGLTLSGKLAELGHDVVIGTRSISETLSRAGESDIGRPAFREWIQRHPEIHPGSFAEVAQREEVVINATNGTGSLEALRQAGEENLDGKVLIDIANPLDFSRGMPPTLSISNTDSLGEEIQREFPRVRVVKTLNTVTAALMVNPNLVACGEHTIFLSGNDPSAKAQVLQWLTSWFGWKHVLDLGDISTVRGVEM